MLKDLSAFGEKVLQEHGFNSLPVDVLALAESKGIVVMPFPKEITDTNLAGILMRNGDQFHILYSTQIVNEAFKRFTIAHELGHYFIEGHIEAVLNESNMHTSREGFSSQNLHERQADSFAAGLLMPSMLCRKVISQYEDGLKGILALSESCQTSLLASAIRYATLFDDKLAIIISQDGKTIYTGVSPALQKTKFFIPYNSSIPSTSLTATCAKNSDFIHSASSGEQEGDLSDWCNCQSCLCYEEVKGLGRTGKILTVLSLQEDDVDDEEDEDNSNFELRFG